MGEIFHSIAYQPLYNILVLFYNFIPFHDLGIAIILTTVVLRLLLVPLYKKQLESQKKMQEIQPKIKELQGKHKNDKESQAKEMMELYKKTGTNPFGGCLPLIIQIFFFIAIYRVIFNISQNEMLASAEDLYFFVSNPGQMNHFFLGFVDLSSTIKMGELFSASFLSVFMANFFHIFLAFLSAVAQFFQTKMLMFKAMEKRKVPAKNDDQPDMAQIMSKQMLVLGPGLAFIFGVQFPAGLSIYWLTGTLFMIGQQKYMEKKAAQKAN